MDISTRDAIEPYLEKIYPGATMISIQANFGELPIINEILTEQNHHGNGWIYFTFDRLLKILSETTPEEIYDRLHPYVPPTPRPRPGPGPGPAANTPSCFVNRNGEAPQFGQSTVEYTASGMGFKEGEFVTIIDNDAYLAFTQTTDALGSYSVTFSLFVGGHHKIHAVGNITGLQSADISFST